MTLLTINDFKKKCREDLKHIYSTQEIESISAIILEEVLTIKRIEQLQNSFQQITTEDSKKLEAISIRLQKREPVQYILGKTFFCNSEFKVSPSVLIPRQETELLIESIVRHPFASNAKSILDIGTGSGCIAISIKKLLNRAEVFALDISSDALSIAKENSVRNNMKINFIQANILSENFKVDLTFDLIVSNPPYVRNSEKQEMHDNVLNFEPHLALFVEDNTPLLFYKAIINFSVAHLASKGILAFEINEAFGTELKDLLLENFFYPVEIIKDLNEKDRIILAQKI
jgi:release factor glutamine methyltransferase